MKRRTMLSFMKSMRILWLVGALSGGIAWAQGMGPKVGMQQAAPAVAKPGVPSTPEASAAPKGKMGLEGVTVHGHWTIDVRNADGTLAQHHEFENALGPSGGGVLVGLLTGQITPGNFAVTLYGSGGSPCGQYCYLVPSLTTQPGATYCSGSTVCAATLTVTPSYGTSFGGPFALTLAGSITANQAGMVNQVYSGLTTCPGVGMGVNPSGPATVLPSACASSTTTSGSYPYLTGTTLATPISVANGQLIQVQVVLSFS